MAGIYTIQWANGASFQVFKQSSRVEIEGTVDDGYQGLAVFFDDTNQSTTRYQVAAGSTDGRTIEITLDEHLSPGHRAVMVEWYDRESKTWTLFGEIFVGDPDGAGGFGGQQDTGGAAED
jgi:hypothetical protein